MYQTEGVDAIATVTELRSDTAGLIERVRENGHGILIQKNNEPQAVLIDHETYSQIKKKLGVTELGELTDGS